MSKIRAKWVTRIIFIPILISGVTLGSPVVFGESRLPQSNSNCNPVCEKIREIEKKSKFVVFILIEGADQRVLGSGSGVLLREGNNLDIITNDHVVAGDNIAHIWIAFRGSSGYQASRVMGRSPAADLARLSVPDLPIGIEAGELGEKLEMGQQLYAVGYPFSMFDISTGYVNSIESSQWLYAWSQAPVNPGGSGGPILNETLQIVGINTAIITGNVTPKSLVLPVEYLRRILPRLRTEVHARHGSLGMRVGDASRLPPSFFAKFGMPYNPHQVKVFAVDVPIDSSAARAGIRAGDGIIKFNGTPVRDAKSLIQKTFFDYRPDETVIVLIERGGQTLERQLTLGEYQPPFQVGKDGK